MESRQERIEDLISLYSYGIENKTQEWLIFKAFEGVGDEDFFAAIQHIGRRKRKGVLLPSEVVDAIDAVRAEREGREREEREAERLERLALARTRPPHRCPRCNGGLREDLSCARHGYWRLSVEEARWDFFEEGLEDTKRLFADLLKSLRERRVFGEWGEAGERELSAYELACLKAGVTPKGFV
jgi:hypothetical protein